MQVTLEKGDFGSWILVAEDGRDILFQQDWDWAPLASLFGWIPCPCGATDGTVDCKKCKRLVSEMLSEAYDYLVDHEGETTQDPGYFD